jgi:flavin-dependent dehydrogenase
VYDAIVVGARCAGSATARLLAVKGYRVLLVDKASFPSDTISTHYIHQPGAAKLKRWGLLDTLAATGCPPIEKQLFDVGPFALIAAPPPADGVSAGYAPRRTVLDKILVDAAVAAGVELRERFSVTDVVSEGNRVVGLRGTTERGTPVTEKARIVIGADGMRSRIAQLVNAPVYNEMPAHSCAYYSYWGDVPMEMAELYPRPGHMVIAAPTNDGLILLISYWPEDQFDRVRSEIEDHFMAAIDLVPSLAARVRAGRRAEKFRGTNDLRNFFRRPHGDGWALVGDAGYHKNPITAEGITDAFRDAELLADAVDAGFTNRLPIETALAQYEHTRNETVMAIYAMTCDLAKLEPPNEDMQRIMAALRHDERQAGRFMGTIAGTVPIPEFFSPQNVEKILSAAAGA